MTNQNLDKINDKILIFDVEMSKAMYFAFPSHRPQVLRVPDRHQGQFMVTAAWKWYGRGDVESVAVTDNKKLFKKNPNDHRHVVETLCKVVSQADVVVGHNLDQFDIKHLQFMAYELGLPPLPPRKSVDTLKAARRIFKHDSLSLGEIAASRGLANKLDVPNKNQIWNDATVGCPYAIEVIREYNIGDIITQEAVFSDMLPWMTNIPYLCTSEGKTHSFICPKCGESEKLEKRGFTHNNRRTCKYQRVLCQSCGSWGTDFSVNLLSQKYLDIVNLLR